MKHFQYGMEGVKLVHYNLYCVKSITSMTGPALMRRLVITLSSYHPFPSTCHANNKNGSSMAGIPKGVMDKVSRVVSRAEKIQEEIVCKI